MTSNFYKKINIQEEMVSLEIMRDKHKWKVEDRVKQLKDMLVSLRGSEIDNSSLLTIDNVVFILNKHQLTFKFIMAQLIILCPSKIVKLPSSYA